MLELHNKEKHYTTARKALLIMLVLSAVNLGLVLFASDTSFVTTAAIPEVLTLLGFMLYSLNAPLYAVILCGVAVGGVLVVYLLCWLFSKKRSRWAIVALVMYAVDYAVRIYLLVCDLYASTDVLMIILRMLIPTAVLVFLILGTMARHPE